MPKLSRVFDEKPKTGFSVFDEKPKNTSVFDEKPKLMIITGEMPLLVDRTLGAGQPIGLLLTLTYPTAISMTGVPG